MMWLDGNIEATLFHLVDSSEKFHSVERLDDLNAQCYIHFVSGDVAIRVS